MMMKQLLAVAAGGAIGAVLRWLMAAFVQRWAGSAFPWGTLCVNVIGSLLLGFIFVYMIERSAANELLRLGLTVGLLGAFTTFSTFSLETIRLLQSGALAVAMMNIVAQLTLCLIAAWLGVQLARQL
ncbi:MAG: fluoride efflux transporter CrcB [Mariprofundaceae bacterium]